MSEAKVVGIFPSKTNKTFYKPGDRSVLVPKIKPDFSLFLSAGCRSHRKIGLVFRNSRQWVKMLLATVTTTLLGQKYGNRFDCAVLAKEQESPAPMYVPEEYQRPPYSPFMGYRPLYNRRKQEKAWQEAATSDGDDRFNVMPHGRA
ncbi:MAG: hypothetical protein FWD79_06050 [Desulfobulbus sp.]|nr:hypothetical protein [Desulfobulbus sp.]